MVSNIFSRLREGESGTYRSSFGGHKVTGVRDLSEGHGFDSDSPDGRPKLPLVGGGAHFLTFRLGNEGVVGTLRTSGTEPKIKWEPLLAACQHTIRRFASFLFYRPLALAARALVLWWSLLGGPLLTACQHTIRRFASFLFYRPLALAARVLIFSWSFLVYLVHFSLFCVVVLSILCRSPAFWGPFARRVVFFLVVVPLSVLACKLVVEFSSPLPTLCRVWVVLFAMVFGGRFSWALAVRLLPHQL